MWIRKMTLGDIEEVLLIERECFSQPWSKKSFQDSLSREDTLFLVAQREEEKEYHMGESLTRHEGNILGYMGMYISFDEADITNVAVASEARRRGVGEALIKLAKEEVKELGATSIMLEVRQNNIPAISLYKKMGFEEIGVRRNFYQFPTEDAILMNCSL